jgi:Domain of Unknown Function (DUF1259)
MSVAKPVSRRTLATFIASTVFSTLVFSAFASAQDSNNTSGWEKSIETVMGMEGMKMPDAVLRFDLPRTDHKTTVKGIFAQPNLVTDGYAAFKQENGGTFMAAELVLLQPEVNPVIEALRQSGIISIEALHNHLIFERPRWMYVHFTGFGDARTLAQSIEAALKRTSEPRTNDDNQQDADDTVTGFDVSQVESILGGDASIIDHVLEISIPCANQDLIYANNHDFPPAMGPSSELHFQSMGNGNAVAAPEICVPAGRVTRVVNVLKQGGFDISAIHNHWTLESPRVFFVHGFATGNAEKLAQVLKAAVDAAHQ